MVRVLVAGLAMSLLASCSLAPFKKPLDIENEPRFFIRFQQGSADINNRFVLSEKLQLLGEESGQLILVAEAMDSETHTIALRRLSGIANLAERPARIVIKPFVNPPHEEDVIAVYFVPNWNADVKRTIVGVEYSDVSELSSIYYSDRKRLYYTTALKVNLKIQGSSALEDFQSFLNSKGWVLSYKDVSPNVNMNNLVASMDVSFLNPDKPTAGEVKQLVESFISQFIPSGKFVISANESMLTIYR